MKTAPRVTAIKTHSAFTSAIEVSSDMTQKRIAPYAKRACAAAMSALILIASGCSGVSSGFVPSDHLAFNGVVEGALQPIADATVHLYAVDPQNPAAVSNMELAAAVHSNSTGAFQFPDSIACPTPDAVIYVVAKGGVPASTGLANPSIELLNVLGTCSGLSAHTSATINEVSTVGSAWPLAAFASDSNQFLPVSGQSAQFIAAAESIGTLVNSDLGTTPGRLLAKGDTAPVVEIYSLANAIASCIVTNGGSAGDGSACGHLFSLAGSDSARLPGDTLTAALQIAKNPARNVAALYTLSASKGIFQPSLTSAPADWTLATTSVSRMPVLAIGPTGTTLAQNTSAAATSPVLSTTPSVGRATAQVTPLVANTIVITTGGTYQGNWVSTDPTVPAVTVQTDQPVIIQNSTVTGLGNLIVANGSAGANLTVQNVIGTGLDPQVAGKARGAFIVAYVMNSLTVQNCTMTGTQFGIKLGFSTVSSVHILNNQAINLEDRASDGNGGFQTTRPQLGHFVLFYQVSAPSGAEVGWNQLVQTMGQSSIDNAVEIYKSQGTSTAPILVHDNYVEGMSSPAVASYIASGFAATGDNTATESAFVSFVSNEVVHTAGFGLALTNGHDNSAQTNRVVSCGQNSSGVWYSSSAVDAIVLWNWSSSPNFYNNSMTTTAGGMIVPNAANQPVIADSVSTPNDLQNTDSGNLFTDPCLVGGVLTLSAEDAERAFWANKLSTNHQTVGAQTAAVAVSVTPATSALVLAQTQQLAATVTNTSNTAVTWSLSTAVGTLSASGIYTAPSTLASITAVTVTATSVADPTKTAAATLTINPTPVVITPSSFSLYASQAQQFSALAQGTANQTMVWSMSPSVGTLSATGLYTSPSSITAVQFVTVTAYSSALNQYTNALVTLLPPVKVNLYSGYFVDTVNQTSQFSAQVQNTSNTAVVWTISPAVGTVSATGLYTAPSSIPSQQSITFTATSVADPTKSASGTVLLNPPVKVSLSPSTVTLLPSATQQFTANVAWTGNTAVTWAMSPAFGTLSSAGLYTAPSTVTSQQTVTVTATSVADTTKSATATVTVNPPVSVSVTPANATVTLNGTQIYTATVLNTLNTNVTWSISPALGSISTGGIYSPPTTAVTSPQTVTVTATSVVDSTRSASATVTVNPPVAISLSPASTSLYASQSQQMTPTVQWNSNTAVIYSISPSVGTISSSGLYTAPATITSTQTVTITADSVADYTKYALAYITLQPPVKVNLYSGYFVDTVNQTSQFSAQVQNTSNTAVHWTISPSVGSVSGTGLYTAPSTITSQQTITFTATSVADPTKSASGTVLLNPPVSVSMSPTAVTLLPSSTQQFNAYVAWNSNTNVTWAVSPALGNISSSGLYTAPSNTTSVQTVMVTATSVADPTKSATATVTLNPPVSVSITPAAATVTLNQTQLYVATVLNTGNTNVTWSINPAFGSISTAGRYAPPTTAVTSPQTVAVTATSVVDTTKSASATVTVNPPVAIAISPSTTSLYASQTQQFTSTVQWNSNTAVTYSLAPAVGSISSAGLYTAPSTITSTQTVTVTVGSVADGTKYALATITLLPPVSVNISSAAYFADTVNQTSQFMAQVLNTSNTAVTWTIYPATGSISSTGLYTAPAAIAMQQTVTVTATSVADPTKTATGTVLLNPPVNVTVIPGSVTLTTSHTQQFTAAVAWNSNTAVVWSMNPSVGTLTASGLYTAPATINANSTVAVTATSVADPTKSATATVNLLTLIGPAPITITEGGTYSGNWISNNPAVAGVTISTDAPVIIQNSTIQGRGQLIQVNGTIGANVTVRNVTGTGLDPQVAGQERGAFIAAYNMQSLVVQNNTMTGVSFGVKIGMSPALTSLSIRYNVGTQLEDRASDGAGGLTTTRPQLGHFVGLYNVTAPNGGEIGWNSLVQTIGQSSTEDAINIYNSQGVSGFPLLVHDNYLEGYSSSTTGVYTGNGLITDGDSSGVTSFVVFQANEMVHTAGGGVALASGHDNIAVANRVVSCGKDSSGNWYSRTGVGATTLWNYYGASNFNNNTITTTAGGMVSPDANGLPVSIDVITVLPVGNSTDTGNLFTDPCLVGGVLNLAAEDTERAYWANKLSTNNITMGDQH